MKTTAAVLFEIGKPLEIIEMEIPVLQAGQVLVKVAYSGVCRSQLMEVQGKRGPDKYLPHLLGHEGAGIVQAIGKGVSKVKVGDRVVLTWIKGCGMDVSGPCYQLGKRRINAGPITTFATHTIVSENRCVRIPRTVPLDLAALFGCAIPTGAGIVMHELQPKPGATAAVFGVGGVGLSAVIALRAAGSSMIVAVDCVPVKLKLARSLGATHTIDNRRQDSVVQLRRLTNTKGVDYSVDATGTVEGIETAFAAVRRAGGLCVFASHPPAGARIRLDPYELICGKQIRGSWGGAVKSDQDIPRLIRVYCRGRLPLRRMITRRFPLMEIDRALRALERKQGARMLIAMRTAS